MSVVATEAIAVILPATSGSDRRPGLTAKAGTTASLEGRGDSDLGWKMTAFDQWLLLRGIGRRSIVLRPECVAHVSPFYVPAIIFSLLVTRAL